MQLHARLCRPARRRLPSANSAARPAKSGQGIGLRRVALSGEGRPDRRWARPLWAAAAFGTVTPARGCRLEGLVNPRSPIPWPAPGAARCQASTGRAVTLLSGFIAKNNHMPCARATGPGPVLQLFRSATKPTADRNVNMARSSAAAGQPMLGRLVTGAGTRPVTARVWG